MRPSSHQRGGIYALSEDVEMKAKLTTLTRRLEELEMRNWHEVQGVNELPTSHPSCFNCQSNSHLGSTVHSFFSSRLGAIACPYLGST